MNTLIIYTHPNHNSLNYAFFQHVIEATSQNSTINDVKVLDLYAENFNPVLFFDEAQKRADMHINPEFEKYRDQIKWADKLIFIYPIWWGRPPAMLLGYIDQLFSHNFAYRNDKPFHTGLLKGKSVICISTMKGPKHYPLFFLNNAHKALMRKAIFNFVGIKKIKFFEFGSAESSSEKQKKNLGKVYNYISALKA